MYCNWESQFVPEVFDLDLEKFDDTEEPDMVGDTHNIVLFMGF